MKTNALIPHSHAHSITLAGPFDDKASSAKIPIALPASFHSSSVERSTRRAWMTVGSITPTLVITTPKVLLLASSLEEKIAASDSRSKPKNGTSRSWWHSPPTLIKEWEWRKRSERHIAVATLSQVESSSLVPAWSNESQYPSGGTWSSVAEPSRAWTPDSRRRVRCRSWHRGGDSSGTWATSQNVGGAVVVIVLRLSDIALFEEYYRRVRAGLGDDTGRGGAQVGLEGREGCKARCINCGVPRFIGHRGSSRSGRAVSQSCGGQGSKNCIAQIREDSLWGCGWSWGSSSRPSRKETTLRISWCHVPMYEWRHMKPLSALRPVCHVASEA